MASYVYRSQILNTVSNGTSIIPNVEASRTLLELNLPFIDRMSNRAYRKFIADHECDLELFQDAFRELITAKEDSEEKFLDYIKGLRSEIAKIGRSDKYQRMRATIAKLGGTLGFFGAFVTLAANNRS